MCTVGTNGASIWRNSAAPSLRGGSDSMSYEQPPDDPYWQQRPQGQRPPFTPYAPGQPADAPPSRQQASNWQQQQADPEYRPSPAAKPRSRHSRPGRNKRPVLLAVAGLAVVLIAAGALLAAGVFTGSGSFTIRGTLENDDAYDPGTSNAANTWVADSNHSGRCLDSETIQVMATVDGRSVAVAAGSPGEGYEVLNMECTSDFTIRAVPGGYAAYGFQIEGVPGIVNMTRAQIAKGVALTISSGS